jgi:hypothetical protein
MNPKFPNIYKVEPIIKRVKWCDFYSGRQKNGDCEHPAPQREHPAPQRHESHLK